MEKDLYIAHGYTASSDKHWFKWLASQFKNVEGHIFDFPNSNDPVLKDWLGVLNDEMDISKNENVIVAHSLGVITILEYLSQYSGPINVKGIVLVAGFSEKIKKLKKLNQYIENTQIDYEKIKNVIPNIICIAGDEDRTVPYQLSVRLAEKLDAPIITLKHDGHFCDRDGYDQFPLVKEKVDLLFNKD